MIRKLFLLAAFAGAATAAFGEDTKAEKKAEKKGKAGAIDKAKVFEKLDADADGKVTKEEYKKGFDKLKETLAEKGGEKAKALVEKMDADKSFEKIDANKDGAISKDEYEKFEPLADLKKKKADK
jgi:Skp family chaperone for outer membrane proteins